MRRISPCTLTLRYLFPRYPGGYEEQQGGTASYGNESCAGSGKMCIRDRRSVSICGRAGRCAVRRALGSGGRDACDRRARSGGAVGRDTGACMEAVRQSDGCDRDDIRKRRMQTVLQSEMHSPFSRTGVYGIRTRGLNNANVARSQLR